MQQSDQKIFSYQTVGIDLKNVLNSLVERKFLIFGLTAFITLLAIIVAFNIPPTYKAVSSFTSPGDSSISNLNKLQLTSESNESVFADFLTTLASKELQKKVFIDGGYLTAFNLKNESEDDVDSFISGVLESVTVSPPALTKKDLEFGFLTELPYSVSMEGQDPVAIANYLNELVATANHNSVQTLFNLVKQKASIRLEQIAKERLLLLAKAKQERLNEIEILMDAAKIAKSLGIIDNNLNQFVGQEINTGFFVRFGGDDKDKGLPDWYLFGEKALLERVNVLNNRTSDEPFIPKLVNLDNEKLKLQSENIIGNSDISSMLLSQVAVTPRFPISPRKRLIVLLSFIGGFMISILLALTMKALKPDENTLPK